MTRLLLVLLLLVAAVAQFGGGVRAQDDGGVLRAGLDVDAGTADPRLARDTSAFRLIELVYDGLVVLDPQVVPQPALAESWENPDPTTWIFHLRQGLCLRFFHGPELLHDELHAPGQLLPPGFRSAPDADQPSHHEHGQPSPRPLVPELPADVYLTLPHLLDLPPMANPLRGGASLFSAARRAWRSTCRRTHRVVAKLRPQGNCFHGKTLAKAGAFG